MIRNILFGLALCVLTAGTPITLISATIDFEGIAPTGGQSFENSTNNVFSGFNVFVPHGHYQDSTFNPGNRPSNGTDWLLHDHFAGSANQPVVITQVGGGTFSATSIDASEWENTFPFGQTLTVTGHLFGGGMILANFVTDNIFGFETFTFGAGWTNLVALDLVGSSAAGFGSCAGFAVCGSLGYDNVVVNPATVPEPGTIVLIASGLVALFAPRRRTGRC